MTPLDGFRLRRFNWNYSNNSSGWTRSHGIKRYQSHYRNDMDAFDSSLKNWKTSSCLAEFFCRRKPKSLNFKFSVTHQLQHPKLSCICDKKPAKAPHVKMVTAKAQVTRIKCICVPRMEVSAALLGSKLMEATLAAISDKRFVIPTVSPGPTLKLQLRGYENFLARGRLSLQIE